MFCLQACKKNDIADKQQLENILFDMHMADGILHTMSANVQEQGVDSVFRYKHIFEKYKCSRDKFERTMRVYSKDKEALDLIYTNVRNRFEELQSRYSAQTNLQFAEDILNKFTTPIKNSWSQIDNFFKDVENFDDFKNKILESCDDLSESEEMTEASELNAESSENI
jgi:hypothetical protein